MSNVSLMRIDLCALEDGFVFLVIEWLDYFWIIRGVLREWKSVGNFTNGGFKHNNYYPMHSVAS